MIRHLPRALLGLACFAVLTACGGTELRPEQQKEYEKLQAERQDINRRIGSATRRSEKAFRDLGAAEKKNKRAFRDLVMCGADAEGQTFGPFPWGKKRRAKLSASGTARISGLRCDRFKFKVVR